MFLDLKSFRCPECNSNLSQEVKVVPFDDHEVEVTVECCDKLYSTFLEATELHLQE